MQPLFLFWNSKIGGCEFNFWLHILAPKCQIIDDKISKICIKMRGKEIFENNIYFPSFSQMFSIFYQICHYLLRKT
jgi:hypothetical protein